MSQPLMLALAQLESAVGEPEKNLARALDVIREAAARGARLVALPELYLPGYAADEAFARLAETVPGPATARLEALCRELGVHAVVGLARKTLVFPHLVYNTAVLVGPRGVVGYYDKIYLGTFGPFREGCYFAPGERAVVLPTPWGKAGLQICYDCSFPELSRALARRGAVLNLVISAGPLASRDKWGHLLRTRAYENAWITGYCNAVGRQGEYVFFGESRVLGPTGEVIAQAKGDAEELLVAEADLDRVPEARYQRMPFRDVPWKDAEDPGAEAP